MPKHMSCHKATVIITRRAHCVHDSIYIMLICFCKILALCVSWMTYDHLHTHIYLSIYIYIYQSEFKFTSKTYI